MLYINYISIKLGKKELQKLNWGKKPQELYFLRIWRFRFRAENSYKIFSTILLLFLPKTNKNKTKQKTKILHSHSTMKLVPGPAGTLQHNSGRYDPPWNFQLLPECIWLYKYKKASSIKYEFMFNGGCHSCWLQMESHLLEITFLRANTMYGLQSQCQHVLFERKGSRSK